MFNSGKNEDVLRDNDDEDGVPHPARRYVRERIERTRWYDPQQKAWAETTVPQQDEAIVPVDTY